MIPLRLTLSLSFLLTLFFPTQGFEKENLTLRGSFEHSRSAFESKKSGTVAFMGGSITEMDGYRPMLMEFLKHRFPQTQFDFINAGISSTCSTTGAFRLRRDVLTKGPIDLFFLEFAVNDDQDASHSKDECIRGMEGIIRQMRTEFPYADIIVTYFVNPGMLGLLQDGKTPISMAAHEQVLEKYQISRIHLARELAMQINAGRFSWEKFGGTHPKPPGNRLCTDMHEKLLTMAWSGPFPQKVQPHFLPKVELDPFCYQYGRFLSPKDIPLAKGWKYSEPKWEEIKGSTRQRYLGRSLLHTHGSTKPISFEFEGQAVGAFVLAGPDAGKIRYMIDGKDEREINLRHRYSSNLHYPRTVMFADDLIPGTHEINIKPHNPDSGTAIRIMEFCTN